MKEGRKVFPLSRTRGSSHPFAQGPAQCGRPPGGHGPGPRVTAAALPETPRVVWASDCSSAGGAGPRPLIQLGLGGSRGPRGSGRGCLPRQDEESGLAFESRILSPRV